MRDTPNILLVDDIEANLLALESQLSSVDARLWKASSAEEALGCLLEREFALALLDVQMPGMCGFELAEAMRGFQKTRAIPIIFITAASATPKLTFQGYEAGAVDVLYKPIDHHILRGKVQVFLELYRQRAQLSEQYAIASRHEQDERLLRTVAGCALSSLDQETTLPRMLRAIVPSLADVATIDLVDGYGRPTRVATAGLDAQPSLVRRRFAELSSVFVPDHPAGRDVGKGQPSLRAWREWSCAASTMPSAFDAVLSVPIQGRGSLLGALSLFADEPGRFTSEKIALAGKIAEYLAMVVLNTGLYLNSQGALRNRDRFISIAAHELKTPLVAASLQAGYLQRELGRLDAGTASLEGCKERAGTVISQIHRCSRMIDDLLDVTRMNGGALAVHRHTFEMGSLLEEVAQRLEGILLDAGCVLNIDLCGQAVGEWDRLKLDQVLTNLLSNAVRYAPQRPIDLRMSCSDRQVEIVVADRGPGIPEEHLTRIFDCYERGNAAGSGAGLGLGLFVARQIVEAHSGLIRAENRPGGGAVFVTRLPLRAMDAARPLDREE